MGPVSASSDEYKYFLFGEYFSEACFSILVYSTKLEKHSSLKSPPSENNSSEGADTSSHEARVSSKQSNFFSVRTKQTETQSVSVVFRFVS